MFSKTKSIFLVIISGILTGLSFYSSSLSFLVWFSLFPLFVVFDKEKRNFIYFYLGGIIFYLTSIFWIGFVTRLGLFVLILYLGSWWALFGLIGRFFYCRPFNIVTLSFLWIILEFFREHLFSGFGWGVLGYSQYANKYLIQIADILGTKFISFLIVTVNFYIFIIFKEKKLNLRKTIYVALILIFCFSYSYYRLKILRTKERRFVAISLIQPNISQEEKWEREFSSVIVAKLKKLGEKTHQDNLVIYPESSWPWVVNEENYFLLQKFIKALRRNVLMGILVREGEKFYNTARLFSPLQKEESYKKIKLVPFGEYVPFRRLFRFIKIINSLGDISKGEEIKIFSYKDKKFSVLICFEDIFPNVVRKFSQRSDFLINITNDAWFRGNPQSIQHFAIMTMRAIENRISIVRCANTGISGWVSFLGDKNKFKKGNREVFVEGVYEFLLPVNTTRSFYNRYGDFFIFMGIFFLGLIWTARLPKFRMEEKEKLS